MHVDEKSMHSTVIEQIIAELRKETKEYREPMSRDILFLYGRDPFFRHPRQQSEIRDPEVNDVPYLILISCLLSLQTRDVVTLPVSIKLFEKVRTPEQMIDLPLRDLEQIIKSINYYKTKAQRLRSVSAELFARFGGKVPSNLNDLKSIKGVGLKTANLVLAEAFGVPAICVDTHVHRLSNHWGLIVTETPEQTEQALRQVLPQKYWIEWSYLLVKWGQNICKKDKMPCQKCEKIRNYVVGNRVAIVA